jgi:hypothetical protein
MRPDCTSRTLYSCSHSVEIENGNLSNSTTDYSEFAHPLACHEKSDYYKELDQEYSRYIEDPSFYIDRYAQLQPGHSGGYPNPQDYYIQDVD